MSTATHNTDESHNTMLNEKSQTKQIHIGCFYLERFYHRHNCSRRLKSGLGLLLGRRGVTGKGHEGISGSAGHVLFLDLGDG